MSFHDLPPEVRFMIYAHLRPPNQHVSLWKLLPEHKATHLSAPSILLTCKSLHREVLASWGSSWPPLVEITLADMHTGMRYAPLPAPTWEPGMAFRKIGRAVLSTARRVRLVGHSKVAIWAVPNRPSAREETTGFHIGYGVKYLVRYFTSLQAVEIRAVNWQAHLWEPALKRLLDGLGSVERVTFVDDESQKTPQDLRRGHELLELELRDILSRKARGECPRENVRWRNRGPRVSDA